MPNEKTEYELAVIDLRERAIAAAQAHDKECGDESGACLERVNIAAFIAHSLGLKVGHMIAVAGILGELSARHDEHLKVCKDADHKHG